MGGATILQIANEFKFVVTIEILKSLFIMKVQVVTVFFKKTQSDKIYRIAEATER